MSALHGGYDILYLVAHGRLIDGEPYLFLENEEGAVARVPGRELAARIHDLADRPRLAVLVSCQSAGTGAAAPAEESAPLAALGPRLAEAGVPAVIAMQGDITMKTAAAFMPVFFRELRRDGLADRAMAVARGTVRDRPDWWMPVLFSRLKSGRIWDTEPETVAKANAGKLRVAPPPEPMQPPHAAGFVGREQELAYFATSLRTDHVAVIAGMAGIGKTTLAARLAQQIAAGPDRVFWHQFHEGEGIETIIWRLAGMLWRHGQPSLWELLQGARQSGGQPPPAEVLLDYLMQLLRGQNYVLCLDDFHHAEEDPLVEKAVERLQTLLAAGEVNLIVTSRRMPTALRTLSFVPLGGLGLADTAELLAARKVALASDLLAELHRRTDGNAELLTLAVQALQRSPQPAQVVKRLVDEDDIETFLLQEVDKGLAADEKLVLSGVAALLGYPGTRNAIEATLASGNLKRTVRHLANRFLLLEHHGALDREYLQHAIVQVFYYDLLSRQERQELHRRAGEYYEREEPDVLRAALYYQRAGEDVRAAELITTDVWGAIYQGQAWGSTANPGAIYPDAGAAGVMGSDPTPAGRNPPAFPPQHAGAVVLRTSTVNPGCER